jgi:hypothetical protein
MSTISNKKLIDSNDQNNESLKIRLKKIRKNSIISKRKRSSIRKSRSQNFLLFDNEYDEDRCEISNFTRNLNQNMSSLMNQINKKSIQ